MNAAVPPKATSPSGVTLDFTNVFKVEELREDPAPKPSAAPAKKVPDNILIGAQEVRKGNAFINVWRPCPKRVVDPAKTTILIVEDDTTTQILLHTLLTRVGYQTRRASSAEEFIAAMQKPPLPDLIILDEATEGLAPLIVAEIWRVIQAIRADGIATLIVDRDYKMVLSQSERAVVLQKGQVVLSGRSSDLLGSDQLSQYLGV